MKDAPLREISLFEVWAELFSKKLLIILFGVVSGAIGVFYALSLPNQFKAEVLTVPVKEEQGGLAALAKSFGGLANVAGLRLGRNRGPDKTDIAIQIIKSQQFINDFVSKHDLLVQLMAIEKAHPVTFELVVNEKVYDEANQKWIRNVEPPKTVEPSPEEIMEAFHGILEVEQEAKSGFVVIGITHYSPIIAQKWVELLVTDINNKMRESDISEAKNSIAYLENLIETTQNSSMLDTFYQLLEEQTKSLMLAESRPEYVFKTVSPATVPEKKASPKRALIVIAFGIVGGLLGVIVVLVRFFTQSK